MMAEASTYDVEGLKKISVGEIANLREYIALLQNIISNLEQDIEATREKAKVFLRSGQKENYGHLMERIHETILRIETCRKCVDECKGDLARKEEKLRDFNKILGQQ
jgi:hypothetical protein